MVAKVIGKVDSKDVIFRDMGEGLWTVTVPYDEDGEYIVEVTAIDEAGNVASATRYLLIVNVRDMTCSIIPLPYITEYIKREYVSDYQNLYMSEYGDLSYETEYVGMRSYISVLQE